MSVLAKPLSWIARIRKFFQLSNDDWEDLDFSDDIMPFGNMAENKPHTNGILFDSLTDEDILNFIDTYTSPLHPAPITIREQLRKKGLDNLIIEIDSSDAFVHHLNIYFNSKDNDHLLLQLFGKHASQYSVLDSKTLQSHSCSKNYNPVNPILESNYNSESNLELLTNSISSPVNISSPPFELWCMIPQSIGLKGKECVKKLLGKKTFSVTIIDWLRLQDPRGSFTKPQLPGQIKPGLGMARDIECLLFFLAQKHKRDGIMNSPEHWYNAYLYSIANYKFMFLNPAYEGWFRLLTASLTKEIGEKGLSAVAWAIAKGMLVYTPESLNSIETTEDFCTEQKCSDTSSLLSFLPISKKKNESSSKQAPIDAYPLSCNCAEKFRQQYLGKPIEFNVFWSSQEEICAVSQKMYSYFKSPEYVSILEECMAVKGSFRIKWE